MTGARPLLDVMRLPEEVGRSDGVARARITRLWGIVVRQAYHEARVRCWRGLPFRSGRVEEVHGAYQAMQPWELEEISARGHAIADQSVDLVNSSGAVGCHFSTKATAILADEVARVVRPGGLALIDSGRDGTAEKDVRALFGARGFRPVHRARSCALDRYIQLCLRKEGS